MNRETQERAHVDFETLLREDRGYQAACDRKVSQALATARANWEREKAAALEEARAGYLADAEAAAAERLAGERAELEAERRGFEARLRQVEVARALQERGLDARFAPYLTGADEAESAGRVETFARLFQEALAQAVSSRMRGGAPRAMEQPPALSRESLHGMSRQEINRQWPQVASLLREGR